MQLSQLTLSLESLSHITCPLAKQGFTSTRINSAADKGGGGVIHEGMGMLPVRYKKTERAVVLCQHETAAVVVQDCSLRFEHSGGCVRIASDREI